jgi:hypothetical protein
MTCKLQGALDDLWGGIIRKFEFDLYQSTIKMDIVTIEETTKNEYSLLFKDVTALYFSRACCIPSTFEAWPFPIHRSQRLIIRNVIR